MSTGGERGSPPKPEDEVPELTDEAPAPQPGTPTNEAEASAGEEVDEISKFYSKGKAKNEADNTAKDEGDEDKANEEAPDDTKDDANDEAPEDTKGEAPTEEAPPPTEETPLTGEAPPTEEEPLDDPELPVDTNLDPGDEEDPEVVGDEVMFDGPGYGMLNWNIYTITKQTFMMRNAFCCWRRFRQIEMRLITDVSLAQTCCQRRKGAGIIRFFSLDPLYGQEDISMLILEVVPLFHKIVKQLIKVREDFARAAGSNSADGPPRMIYKGPGYACCPIHCCNTLCPTTYKITTEDLLEQSECCNCCGCCSCTRTVGFMSMRRVFQVQMTQNCCQYCCMCCPDAGDIKLWTTDDSAGNIYNIRIPEMAVRTFQRIRKNVDLETAMLERIKAKRISGAATGIVGEPM